MYNQYSFYIELGCGVTNVAYKGWIWPLWMLVN